MCAKARQQPRMPEQCSTKGQQRQARPSVATNARQQPQPVQMQQQENAHTPAFQNASPSTAMRMPTSRKKRPVAEGAAFSDELGATWKFPSPGIHCSQKTTPRISTLQPVRYHQALELPGPNTKTKPKSAPRRRPVKMTSPIWVKVSHLAWSVHVCTHVYRYTLYACLHVCRSASMDVWMRVSARILHVYIRSRAQVSNLPKTGSQHRLQR